MVKQKERQRKKRRKNIKKDRNKGGNKSKNMKWKEEANEPGQNQPEQYLDKYSPNPLTSQPVQE